MGVTQMKKKAMCVGVLSALLAAGYTGAAWGGEDDGEIDRESMRAGPAHGNMGNRGQPANKPDKPAHPEHPAHPTTPGQARRLNPNNVSLCEDPTLVLV